MRYRRVKVVYCSNDGNWELLCWQVSIGTNNLACTTETGKHRIPLEQIVSIEWIDRDR
jgi:hypothetical protein